MILLSATGICKSYITDEILSNLTFNIQQGDKVGLVGANGSGKTTLLNILTNQLSYDSGEVYKQKGLEIGYLKQGSDLGIESTLYDECLKVFNEIIIIEKKIKDLEMKMSSEMNNIILDNILLEYQKLQDEFNDLDGYEYESRIHGVLKGLGFEKSDLNKDIRIFSGGQKARIQLAKLLLSKPDILFLDEPTNHLDLDAIDFLQGFLRDYSGSILLISHDRYFLDKVANKIFLLENKKIETYKGNYSKFTVQRAKDLKNKLKAYENQQKEIKRQQEIIEKFASYGNARLIKQSQSRKKLLDKMKLVEEPQESSNKFNIKFTPLVQSGNDVLCISNLAKRFNNDSLFENVNIDIFKGEKVGLIGPNGVGKTTLLKMILGKSDISEGSIRIGSQVHIGYYEQEQKELNLENTILDEIWNDYPNLSHYEIRSYLAKFMFIGDDIFKELSELSGGEKARVSLLKLMLSSSNFLLMDEPTNHLDIDSKEVLEDALLDYEGTCFIISHDRYFLNKVLDKIIVLDKGGTSVYLGNYDYYIEKINENTNEEIETNISKTQIHKEKKKQKEIEKRKSEINKEVKKIEKEISYVENKLSELNLLLADPSNYEDTDYILILCKEIEELQDLKDNLYIKWMELLG